MTAGLHPLKPLLAPRSVAVVGASARAGSVGLATLRQCLRYGFEGPVWPVNPGHAEIDGLTCHPSCTALPAAPDLAILVVGDARLEAALADAIAGGARAAVIFSSGRGEEEPETLSHRLRDMAEEAGIPLMGPNCMGFYNFTTGAAACGFAGSDTVMRGGVTLISHSGSVLCSLVDCEDRIGFNLAISAGNELIAGLADYMDYALDQPETRVICLFMETARRPAEFRAALEKARHRGVPVIALKVGRTERSAALAVSHSGAIAGADAAYSALFDRYGVIRVETLDEMAATAALLAHARPVGSGGLAAMFDSGGERGLWIDLADRAGVRFGEISTATRAALAARLDPGLEPVNPLDAWGTGHDYETVFEECLLALAEDSDVGLACFVFDREGGGRFDPSYVDLTLRAAARTETPVAIVAPRHGSGTDPRDVDCVRAGVPVIDGDWWMLQAARHAFEWRDHRDRVESSPPAPPPEGIVAYWRARLAGAETVPEAEALALLEAFGVPAVPRAIVADEDAAVAAADGFGYPVALKTASGLAHKSEAGGVLLGLGDAGAVREAWRELAARLGPEVQVSPMAPAGVEMALGVVNDPDFGPVVMIGAGGVAVELQRDARFLLAPFGAEEAHRAVASLDAARLLAGFRGRPACEVDAFAEAAARLSVLAVALAPVLAELDANPVIVSPGGALRGTGSGRRRRAVHRGVAGLPGRGAEARAGPGPALASGMGLAAGRGPAPSGAALSGRKPAHVLVLLAAPAGDAGCGASGRIVGGVREACHFVGPSLVIPCAPQHNVVRCRLVPDVIGEPESSCRCGSACRGDGSHWFLLAIGGVLASR